MLINEKLKPSNLTEQMHDVQNQLEKVLKETEDKLIKMPTNLPKGRISIQRSGKKKHYYFAAKGEKKKYIPISKINIVKQVAEIDYLLRLKIRLSKQIKVLKSTISVLKKNPLPYISEARTDLFAPVTFPNEVFAKKWQIIENPAEKRTTDFITERGESVCSKSELMIANALNRRKIPYHYEMPLNLKGYGVVHPDFLCLNTRNHKEMIWEHLGMMDNSEYASKAVAKIQTYSSNGFTVGRNLIISMETRKNHLSTQEISKMIDEFLA